MGKCRTCGQNAGNNRRKCKMCSLEDRYGVPSDYDDEGDDEDGDDDDPTPVATTDGGVPVDTDADAMVYVAARGNRGGTPHMHTDRDCPALARATKILEKPRNQVEGYKPPCRVCEGYERARVSNPTGFRDRLDELAPEDLGLSPLSESSTGGASR